MFWAHSLTICYEGHDFNFLINGHEYRKYYPLANNIYRPWSCFVQTMHELQNEMKSHCAMKQKYEHSQGLREMLWGAISAMGHHKKSITLLGDWNDKIYFNGFCYNAQYDTKRQIKFGPRKHVWWRGCYWGVTRA